MECTHHFVYWRTARTWGDRRRSRTVRLAMVFSGVGNELDRVQQMIEKSGLLDHLFMGPWSVLVPGCPCHAGQSSVSSKVPIVACMGGYMGPTMAGQPDAPTGVIPHPLTVSILTATRRHQPPYMQAGTVFESGLTSWTGFMHTVDKPARLVGSCLLCWHRVHDYVHLRAVDRPLIHCAPLPQSLPRRASFVLWVPRYYRLSSSVLR